jgi:hypothetical protein
MRDQEMEQDQPLDDSMGQGAGPTEMAQAIAAVIGKTRQEWAARAHAHAAESAAVPFVNRSRLVRPYFRLVLAAKDYAIANGKPQAANLDIRRGYAFDSQD